MITLHAYFLRELLKNFGLALLALTVIFTMGGGLYNVLRYEGISTADLVVVTPWMIPFVLAITMPVAALFAATVTYGRFAADNEFLACRAAGINVHRLFASAIVLSVFVALFTLFAVNILVPDSTARIERFARTNLRDIAKRKLEARAFVDYGTRGDMYLLTGDAVRDVRPEAIRAANLDEDPRVQYLALIRPKVLQRDRNNQLVRYVSAEFGLCQFDTRTDPMTLTILVSQAYDVEGERGAAFFEQQAVGPLPFMLPMKQKPAFMDLKTLLRWRREPWEGGAVREAYRDFTVRLARERLLEWCESRLSARQAVELADALGHVYDVRADAVGLGAATLELSGVSVESRRTDGTRLDSYRAPFGTIAVRTPNRDRAIIGAARDDRLSIVLRLDESSEQAVMQIGPQATRGGGQERSSVTIEDIDLPGAVAAEMRDLKAAEVFDPAAALALSPTLQEKRQELFREAGKLKRKILSLVHFRFSAATSVIVVLVMGAALGVIFRGARILSAFGLAFVPFGIVLVLIVMGRSLTEKPATEQIGPVVIWGGLALVAFADVLILRLGVRR